MKMTDLRVKVDASHFDLFNDFAQAGSVSEAHALFFAAACVGFRFKKAAVPLKRVDKFWSRTFTADEWACMYAMALTHWGGDFELLQDDRAVISLMEDFAAGGLNYLLQESLGDFILRGEREPRLDISTCDDLTHQLLLELWQMSEQEAT